MQTGGHVYIYNAILATCHSGSSSLIPAANPVETLPPVRRHKLVEIGHLAETGPMADDSTAVDYEQRKAIFGEKGLSHDSTTNGTLGEPSHAGLMTTVREGIRRKRVVASLIVVGLVLVGESAPSDRSPLPPCLPPRPQILIKPRFRRVLVFLSLY